MWIWIRLDEIEFIVRRETQIDARVTVDREQTINLFAGLLNFLDQRRIEIFRELALQSPAFSILLVPLRFVGRDLRFVRRHLAKNQLANWENLQPRVAHNAHVKFAAVDVLLGDRVAFVFLMNEGNSLPELIFIFNE